MILFYNLQTGKIVGTIEGRTHPKAHMAMYIGTPEENGRIVCNWTSVDGENFYPEIAVFAELEGKTHFEDYIVDVNTREVIKVN